MNGRDWEGESRGVKGWGAIYRRRHIIRNAFAHNFIVIAVERKLLIVL